MEGRKEVDYDIMMMMMMIDDISLFTDIDECLTRPCQYGSKCINTAGSYTCMCPVGLTGQNCEKGNVPQVSHLRRLFLCFG